MHRGGGEQGFTLLEILLVLGIIGALAGLVFSALPVMSSSQVNQALREVAASCRATYDNAVLEGRLHRLVIKPKTGEYWAEMTPSDADIRPPGGHNQGDLKLVDADSRAKWLEELNDAAADAESRSSTADEKRKYGARSILLTRRKVFNPIKWLEIDDQVLYRRVLPGDVAFVSVQTEAMDSPVRFDQAQEDDTVFIFFFPMGVAQRAVIHLGFLEEGNTIAEKPRFTLKLDAMSGQSEIVDDFEEVDFRGKD